MPDDNSLDALAELPENVLAEVVREGELTLASQMTVAAAADQRALAFAAVTLAAATAVLGGVGALAFAAAPDWAVMFIGAILGAGLISSGGFALYVARPVKFCFPGNEPLNWLPARWSRPPAERHMVGARLEQAAVLQSQIVQNRVIAAKSAWLLRAAMLIAFVTVAGSALVLLGVLIGRASSATPAPHVVSIRSAQ